MARVRLFASIALLALLLGAAGALAWWGVTERAGGATEVRVQIVGPASELWNGSVRVPNATALTALEAAARDAGLDVKTESYPGMGAYVRAIGPYEAHGASGWIYEVDDGQGWVLGDRSAALYPLSPGESLRWRWIDG